VGGASLQPDEPAALAGRHLLSLQREDGCWEGEVIWCPVILAQVVIVRQLLGRPADAEERAGILRHFERTRTGEGGWGLHPDSPATVFVTALAYVALRMLGVGEGDPLASPAREWLRAQPGGVLAIPTWGKLWLAFLGLYEYEGIHPCPPEIFLLPEWLPFHPSRFYCHTRAIYMAMAYLYGRRYRADLGPLGASLRRELYGDDAKRLDPAASREAVAPSDSFVRPGPILAALSSVLGSAERVVPRGLRAKALDRCLDRIVAEQRASRFQALSPVNGVLNCLALGSVHPPHPELAASLEGLESWKWTDPERGVRYAGARSNAWDTALAMQALLETADGMDGGRSVSRAYAYLRDTQLTEELPELEGRGRQSILGGWCFSDGKHRWPVSDCTAEALSALLRAHERPELLAGVERVPPERLRLAARFILDRQNPDGGFATYERRRGPEWLESLNPSEMFGNCMTERSYVECTGSCLDALARYRVAQPGVLGDRVRDAIGRGERFLRAAQRPDGSFPAAWGIQFTYSAFFAVRGLLAAGAPKTDAALGAAARWLAEHQKTDGGWGEHWRGCLTGEYREHPESQVTMTSWAVLALSQVEADGVAVRRGADWLAARQRADGSWPPEAVNGVFFQTAVLDYTLYRAYFPLWALARYAAHRGKDFRSPQ
jgi:2,3-oxidosqualene cyclase